MKNKNKRILLIGGEGYIGKIIYNYLLSKKYKTKTYDNLIYSDKFKSNNMNFIFGDIRNYSSLRRSINNSDVIVILAGLVGDPITKKYPIISEEINTKAILLILKNIISFENKKIIFVSTCSNYGIVSKNQNADENFKLKPLSSYAKSKVKIEKYLIKNKNDKINYTILRFATAFGVSPRMRFDLTINQFVRDVYYNKKLKIYDSHTWRPYCHVLDFAKIISIVIEKPLKSKNQIFNVGHDKNNFSKQMIISKIKSYFPNLKIIYEKNDVDKRNYKVNFKKIYKILKVRPSLSIDYGIKEIINFLNKKPKNFYNKKNKFGNYILNNIKIKYDKSP